MGRAARRFSLLPSTLPLSLPRSPSAPPAGATLVQHATLLSDAAAPARTKRISPGLARGLAAALGRSTHSLAHPFPSLRFSQLLPLPSTLSFSVYPCIFLFLLRSSAYGTPTRLRCQVSRGSHLLDVVYAPWNMLKSLITWSFALRDFSNS